ncbi:MAG: hypothetical protein NT023_23970 [Armatimonadetes bacterium]|nr:hypothetical protein [Armatimonadota bacterium]
MEAKQRAYASLPPWKRPPDFENFNKDGLYQGSTPHKTKSLERPERKMNGLQSCGLILTLSIVGFTVLLISSPRGSSYDSSPSNTPSSVASTYTPPTPPPTIADSTFADKEMYDIVARLTQKTGESEERVRITLTTARQVLADKGIEETLVEYARHLDGTFPEDMNGQKVGLVGVCGLYNAEKKMNKQGKGLFGEDLAK